MISCTSKAQLMALCPGHDTQDGALTQALEALWAVRVLDAAALQVNPTNDPADWVTSWFVAFSGLPVTGATPQDARLAVAKLLVAEDPTLSPKGWP